MSNVDSTCGSFMLFAQSLLECWYFKEAVFRSTARQTMKSLASWKRQISCKLKEACFFCTGPGQFRSLRKSSANHEETTKYDAWSCSWSTFRLVSATIEPAHGLCSVATTWCWWKTAGCSTAKHCFHPVDQWYSHLESKSHPTKWQLQKWSK